ncbi:MAG: SpoIIE family protein phosphatase [Bacteroidales bacterium]|nr:SpoIIE family protein phosphatase [Bacteroidales bacterium]MBN2758042.1 SpoIIE family protein phosphatase [Bacteroidales bacterium]
MSFFKRQKNIKKVKYRGLRIYSVAFILFYLLTSPLTLILYTTNFSKLHDINELSIFQQSAETDSLLIENELVKIENEIDSLEFKKQPSIVIKDEKAGNKLEFEVFFFNLLLFVFLLGFLFNLPFKIYFKRLRKNKIISNQIKVFCKKTLLYSPLINTAIIAISFIGGEFFMINKIFIINDFNNNLGKEIYIQYWIIFTVSAILTLTFVYYWQKYRVQIHYLDSVFTKEELKKSIFKFKKGKIKYRMVLSGILTTFLPIGVAISYIFLSISFVKDLDLYAPTETELKILLGDYKNIFGQMFQDHISNPYLYYINIPNTFLMSAGIVMGVFVTIIYLYLFVYWSNSQIIKPVKELLGNMQKTTSGNLENYSIVRTNDEIGELSENYNIMTDRLFEYISRIDKMNAELEDKVKERTLEIMAQKEEIQAQRDEVESQRDEIEMQRDYVVNQRDLISIQKKSITDSIEYAGNIQKAILPPLENLNESLGDYFIINKPKDIISGDFYWTYQLSEKNKQILVAAADCTGHGVPGALMSMLGITSLNEIVVEKKIFRPNEILNNLRLNLIKTLHQTSDKINSRDGIDISLCYINFDELYLEFAGAYNSIYIIRNNLKQNEIENILKNQTEIIKSFLFNDSVLIEIKADKIPIGISRKDVLNFSLKKFKLKKDDKIYMFSDGYADQFGGKKRLKFMYRKFKEILLLYSKMDMNEQKIKIIEEFENWRGKEKQIDDILIIGINI